MVSGQVVTSTYWQAMLLYLVKRERRWRVWQAVRRLAWALAACWLLTSSLPPEPSSVYVRPYLVTTYGWLVPWSLEIRGEELLVESYHHDEVSAARLYSVLVTVMVNGRRPDETTP